MIRAVDGLNLPREAAVQNHPSDWKLVFQLAQSETDPQRRNTLCERARQLINDRSLELADEKMHHAIDATAEENELNQALRDLWSLQNRPS